MAMQLMEGAEAIWVEGNFSPGAVLARIPLEIVGSVRQAVAARLDAAALRSTHPLRKRLAV